MAKLNFNLVTVKHYAEIVGKSPETVRDWINDGKLKAKKDRGGRSWLILVTEKKDLFGPQINREL